MATLTKKHKELANKLGQLLAKSNLDDETKDLVLEKAGELSEQSVYKLVRVLQGEQKDLDVVAFDINLFLREQDENWSKTKEEQKNAASVIANTWLMKST